MFLQTWNIAVTHKDTDMKTYPFMGTYERVFGVSTCLGCTGSGSARGHRRTHGRKVDVRVGSDTQLHAFYSFRFYFGSLLRVGSTQVVPQDNISRRDPQK